MSLRVLLADESSSIKKAFELALQDYQVKVQTVHQGVDVTEIHQSFQPDICFMDIMLPKLNGYDACKALKESGGETAQSPVVLMWSGFMELDTEKFKTCGAAASIEKPFETKTLRDLVQKLVPSLNQNEISSHLIFDDNDDEVTAPSINPEALEAAESMDDLPPLNHAAFGDETSIDLTEPGVLKDSDMAPLHASEPESHSSQPTDLPEIDTSFLEDIEANSENDDDWSEGSIDLVPEGLDDVDAFSVTSLDDNDALPFEAPEGLDLPPIPAPDFGLKEDVQQQPAAPVAVEIEQEQLPPLEAVESLPEESAPETPLKSEEELIVTNNTEIPQLSKDELKRLILAQSKDIIESVVWDVVPELAKEMIQKEINRLTGEVQIESDLR